MSSPQLLVPDHIARSEKAKKSIAAAYVDEKLKYLDPSRLSKSLKERLPQPTGWRILVMPYMGKPTSDGRIHSPDAVRGIVMNGLGLSKAISSTVKFSLS